MKSGDILGTTVREARISAGMTQERLAEEMGVTPTHIKHIESGHRKPSVELLFALEMCIRDSGCGKRQNKAVCGLDAECACGFRKSGC